MASLNITIKLTDKVSNKLDRLNSSLNKVAKGFNNMNAKVNQVSNSVTQSVTKTNKLHTALKRVTQMNFKPVKKQVDNVNKSLRTAGSSASWLGSKLKWLASVYLGVMGGKAIVGASDANTSAMNMYRYVGMAQGMDKASAEAMGQETMNKIFGAAQRARTSYSEMLSNVGKGMVLAPDAFGNNMENAILFQEIMAKTYKMGDKSAAEQASSMYQLMQALGSGILQGDELRSVNEGATMAYKIIERYAQSIYNSNESLKEMASQGKITSALVVEAILKARNEVDKAFADTTATFSDMWTMFKNHVQQAFRPFLTKLSEIANSPAAQFLAEQLTPAIYAVGNAFTWVADQIEKAVNWIADNWDWLGATIQNVGAIALIVLTAMAVAWTIANLPIILTIGAIVLLAYILNEFGVTAGEVLGAVCGGFLWLVAILWNFVIGALQAIINTIIVVGMVVLVAAQLIVQCLIWVWTAIQSVLLILWEVIQTIGYGLLAGAKMGLQGVVGAFGAMATAVLGILYAIASAIDAVFGSGLASTVEGWMSGLDGKLLEVKAKLDPKNEFDKIGEGWKETTGKIGDMWHGATTGEGAYGDRWLGDNMAGVIEGGMGWIDNVNKTHDALRLDPDKMWEMGSNFGSKIGNGLSGLNLGNIPRNPAEDLLKGNMDDIVGNLGDIAGNTGDISSKMDVSEDNLKYLRQLAEQEAINKFTTAEIKVDMTNHNTVHGTNDLAGIATYLADVVREELEVAAEGVHA